MRANFVDVDHRAPFESTDVGRTQVGLGANVGLRFSSGVEIALGGDYQAGDDMQRLGANLSLKVRF